MKPADLLYACVITLGVITTDLFAMAPQRSAPGSLRVVVHDPSGAVIPGAVVQVTDAEGAGTPVAEVKSDGQGVAVSTGMEPGRYSISVSFPGFETKMLTDVRIKSGETRRDVTLSIQKLDQSVSVGRDPATAASDPNGIASTPLCQSSKSTRCRTTRMKWRACSKRWPGLAPRFGSMAFAAAGFLPSRKSDRSVFRAT